MPTAAPKHTATRALAQKHDSRLSARERGYTVRWQKARGEYLSRHPLCVICMRGGQVTPATVVDHIVPHKGDDDRFWDVTNWQALCKPCHDYKTAVEDGGFGRGAA